MYWPDPMASNWQKQAVPVCPEVTWCGIRNPAEENVFRTKRAWPIRATLCLMFFQLADENWSQSILRVLEQMWENLAEVCLMQVKGKKNHLMLRIINNLVACLILLATESILLWGEKSALDKESPPEPMSEVKYEKDKGRALLGRVLRSWSFAGGSREVLYSMCRVRKGVGESF